MSARIVQLFRDILGKLLLSLKNKTCERQTQPSRLYMRLIMKTKRSQLSCTSYCRRVFVTVITQTVGFVCFSSLCSTRKSTKLSSDLTWPMKWWCTTWRSAPVCTSCSLWNCRRLAVTDTVNKFHSIWFSMCTLQVSEEEVSKLLVTGIEPMKKIHPCFAEFTYTPRSLPDDTTPMVRTRTVMLAGLLC